MICNESKPYIFISYSHRDSEQVVDIINHLVREGYNVWFDEGIDPGTEWDENIAKHIKGSSYFLAFVSEKYINSKNCKDELNYSRSLDKKQLLVYLEDATLPDGMMMRMNRIQSIHWDRYSADRIDEAYAKLYSASGLEITKISDHAPDNWKEYIVPEHRKNSEKANSNQNVEGSTEENNTKEADTKEVNKESIENSSEINNLNNKKDTKKKDGAEKKNKVPALIGIGVACVLLIAGCIFAGINIKKTNEQKKIDQLVIDGLDYLHGTNGKEYNPATALDYFVQADEQGSEEGTFLAGYTVGYEMRGTFDIDEDEAFKYIEKIEETNGYACILKGNMYIKGCMIKSDTDKAQEYWEKGLDIIGADTTTNLEELVYVAEAYEVMGSMYKREEFDNFDYEIAKEYFTKSAEYGSQKE